MEATHCTVYSRVATSILFVALSGSALAQTYSVTDLSPTNVASQVSGINASGQVVGWVTTASGNPLATIWSGSTTTYLPSPGNSYSYATGINNAGQVVGYGGTTQTTLPTAMTWSGTTPVLLTANYPYNTGNTSFANAINNSGFIAGQFGAPEPEAWYWNGATSGQLNNTNLTDGESNALAVNDSGQVVGWSQVNGVNHGVLWSNTGVYAQDLGTLGGTLSTAFGINNSGLIVGWADTASGAQHASLWKSPTSIVDLGTLGGASSAAYGINSAGQIVGQSQISGSSSERATLWSGNGQALDLNSVLSSSAEALYTLTSCTNAVTAG
jgi:probable HAF family extracellular repeat protein